MSATHPTEAPTHLTTQQLTDGMDEVRRSPRDGGRVEMIVSRPDVDERVVLDEAMFTVADGLVGDTWLDRGSSRTEDGSAHPDMQVAVMNARYLDLIADGDRSRWPLAGDQLLVDLDLHVDAIAAGDRFRVGEVVFEATPQPHTGCKKFSARFGVDAVRFANDEDGKRHRLRGMYWRVVEPGTVRPGDTITRV